MSDSDPFRRNYSTLTKVAFALFAVGLVAPLCGVLELAANNHPGGMAAMGYAAIFMISIGVGVVANIIGAIVASTSRWRGYGEAQAALLCAGGIVGVPLLSLGVLSLLK